MDPQRPGPRPGLLSDLESRLLAAAVGGRLFRRPAEPVMLGRYRLLERLGQGGMGVVFRALDPELRRHVAIKLLHPSRGQPDREQHARLRREARALGRLSHPNVVQVFEIGEVDDGVFVVMELVRGTTLRAWLGEPRGLAEILRVVVQAGRGLAAAHAAGIVHRDFKPENVLVGDDGRVRVVDFGLARASEGPAAEVGAATGSLEAPLTKSGTVLGTPAFMAPEQLRGPAGVDARSDQFSFCVMAHEALYGERPFEDMTAVAAGAVRAAPAGSAVPPGLRAALLRGLQHDPADRWSSMDELLAALERETPVATGDAASPAPRGPRPRWIVGSLVGLSLAVGAAIGVPAWQARLREQAARERLAVAERQLAAMLAEDRSAAAEGLLAGLAGAPDEGGPRIAAKAWASWARMLAPGRASREAWAHAYVLAGDDGETRQAALLGLARAHHDAPAEVLALIAAEAPDLSDTPELSALRSRAGEPDASAAEQAEGHARRLAEAAAPREVVALARAGLVDLAASTLLSLARDAAAPTRPAWQLAAAPIVEASGDDARALALLAAAAQEPGLQDAAREQQVALLLRHGRLDEAARVHATRLATGELAGDARVAAEALRDRLAATLAARSDLSLRFTGAAASPWTALEPALLRGEPGSLVVDSPADAGTLAAWSLELAGDRMLVEVDARPLSLAGGAAFTLRVVAAGETAELGLHVAGATGEGEGPLPAELQLRCGASRAAPVGPVREDGSHAALTLQLDIDAAGGAVTCRLLDASRRPILRERSALTGSWPPGPLRLELRGGEGVASADMRLELTRVALTGAVPGTPQPPGELARAGALLVDGDTHAAARALAGLAGARARLWQAVALARLGRWQEAAPRLDEALAEEPDGFVDVELQRWLRGEPRALAPALRQMLGERRYLELFARTWERTLDSPRWSPEVVRAVLAELGGIEEQCDAAAACARLLRARGRALVQIGERAQAQRALESALAAVPADAAGRALAGRILVDLTLVKTSR